MSRGGWKIVPVEPSEGPRCRCADSKGSLESVPCVLRDAAHDHSVCPATHVSRSQLGIRLEASRSEYK